MCDMSHFALSFAPRLSAHITMSDLLPPEPVQGHHPLIFLPRGSDAHVWGDFRREALFSTFQRVQVLVTFQLTVAF